MAVGEQKMIFTSCSLDGEAYDKFRLTKEEQALLDEEKEDKDKDEKDKDSKKDKDKDDDKKDEKAEAGRTA